MAASDLKLFSLEGKVALVSGAGSGIGKDMALTLAKAGAVVVAGGRRVNKLEELVAEVKAATGRDTALALKLDVASVASCRDFVRVARERFGRVDILVNCAGIPGDAKPIVEVTEESWDAVMDTNVKGTWFLSQAFARTVIDDQKKGVKRGASIINISSILGNRVQKGMAEYCASKAAISHLTRQNALEWAKNGIRVNTIQPGYFLTDINDDIFKDGNPIGKKLIENIAFRRVGQIHELRGALLLLASEAGSFMTGSSIVVDGGHLHSSL